MWSKASRAAGNNGMVSQSVTTTRTIPHEDGQDRVARTYTRWFPQVLSEVILLEQNQPVRQRSSSFGYMSISSGGRVR